MPADERDAFPVRALERVLRDMTPASASPSSDLMSLGLAAGPMSLGPAVAATFVE